MLRLVPPSPLVSSASPTQVNTARSEVSKFGLDADSSRRRLAEILGADDGRIADDWNESDGAGVGRALEEVRARLRLRLRFLHAARPISS